ncbi:protein spire homolog 1 isoform X2 [Conger conger]|uniref:protein spire homolog 1 isoform X2 n=1 Tax=Conger conger TaxID=82655 RepID=UPI002A5AD893|nr:protein spire homolog 1 isoform X2 [Conger conger]
MEYPVYVTATSQISLDKILELQDQPINEEQAWALCYQLCTLLSEDQYARRGEFYTSRRMVQLPGRNNILLINDGNVCLRMDDSSTDYFAFETEDELVDYLGRLIYSCLDWGLDSSVERELNETLEVLLCQMTKVNLQESMQESFQPLCTFSEVIQICENRLYEPAQAARHYRDICSALFSDTVELCQYFHNVQRNKDALQKIIVEPETRTVSQDAPHWVFAWKHLMEDLCRGVTLRPVEWLNLSTPLPVEHSPFQQLLEDIKIKRYKLRNIQTVGKTYMSGHHEALLKAISSRSNLKPALERKLKTRPKEKASLHELLMGEIRKADQLKLLSSRKKRFSDKDDCFSPLNCPIPYGEGTATEDNPFLLSPFLTPKTEEEPFKEPVFQQVNTGVGPEWEFCPALSSSPLDPFCGSSRRHSRSCSLGSHLYKLERSCAKVNVPLTISEVIKRRQTEMRTLKNIYSDRFKKWRVCSSCSKRSLYFTWHNCCFLCNRVVCPECCMKMHLPYKWCVNLPVSFFKKIVLSNGCERDVSHFWRERSTWDHTRVPLVLESHITNTLPQPGLAMRDWYSQDICTECKKVLLEACDSVFRLSPVPSSKEI